MRNFVKNWEKISFVIIIVAIISLGSRMSNAKKNSELFSAPNKNITSDTYNQSASILTSPPRISSDTTPPNEKNPVSYLKSSNSLTEEIFYRYREDQPPNITAAGAILADLETGETYFEIRKNNRWPIASITKLMTSLKAIKNTDIKQITTITEKDFESDDSLVKYLKLGESYSINDLIKTMLTVSSNEAASAIANTYGREIFIRDLNSLANDLGMNSTNFNDPTGLSSANQSTPEDLRKLVLEIYSHDPELLETTRKQKTAIKELTSGKTVTLSNINSFAGRSDFIGGKTGFTDDAQGNLLSLFSYKTRPIIIVVLGTTDRFGETDQLISWFKSNYTR
jgi:D-alanyl-D-alanine carboxypeptidase